MKKLEHVGIAVKSLKVSVPLFEKLLSTPCYKTEEVSSENVITAFFDAGSSKVELLESTAADGIIAKFIEKRGEGLHHVAFEVTDLVAEVARLKNDGFEFLNETPKQGADNKLICFLHPRSTNGLLVELCQDMGK
ncbi:MAG TPA: methylmalonyl-CoA epimerase [Chitinophagaceae bacterium]